MIRSAAERQYRHRIGDAELDVANTAAAVASPVGQVASRIDWRNAHADLAALGTRSGLRPEADRPVQRRILVARNTSAPEEQLALFVKLAFIAIALSSIDSYPSSDSVPSLAALTARVTLTSLAAGGEAVGRLPDGRVVFVPGSAPDELADVAIEEVRKGYVRALLRNIVRPSPHRVNPACVLATPGRCGGCPLMHIAAKPSKAPNRTGFAGCPSFRCACCHC